MLFVIESRVFAQLVILKYVATTVIDRNLKSLTLNEELSLAATQETATS